MIRVAIVCSTLNQIGGPARHMRNLYACLKDEEFRFTIILCSAVEEDLREFMRSGGVPDQDMIFISHAKKRALIPFVLELRDIFRQEKFDIVHAFETQTQVLAGVAARWAGVRKFICQCEAQFLPATISRSKRVLFRVLNFFLKGYFSCSITVSHGLASELMAGRLRREGTIEVVHLGIVCPSGEIVKELPQWPQGWNAPVIGSVGRLSVEKGVARFIKAAVLVAKELPSARFVICGDGPELGALQELARKLSIDKQIEFRPWAQDVTAVLRTFDIFVMPSLREGLPMTLLEAMSVGLPVIASDIEGIRDIVHNGVEGILLNTADTATLAMEIISLCSTPETAVKMGKRAAAKVREHFNVEKEMQRIREIYRETVGKSGA